MSDSAARCQTCRDVELSTFLSLGMQPAVHFPANAQEAADEQFYPLDLGFCPKCSLVQITQPVNERILFSDGYHHIAGLTKSYRSHVGKLASELAAHHSPGSRPGYAIEIGSNDGTLLDELGDRGFDVLGVDPCGTVSPGGRQVVKEYFGAEIGRKLAETYRPADFVLALNTFAHVTNVHDFLDGVCSILGDDGTFVSESHYLADLIESLQYDFAYHEHSRYYSVKALEEVFKAHGLEIYRIQRIATHGGSIRVFAGFKGAHEKHDSVPTLLNYEGRLQLTDEAVYHKFASRVVNHRDIFRRMLRELADSGARVAGASFPARAGTLLNYCDLGPADIEFISEISPLKIGRLSPGTHIPIEHQSRLCGPGQPPYALLLSWHIADELIPRLRAEGFSGKFIVPLPEPQVIA